MSEYPNELRRAAALGQAGWRGGCNRAALATSLNGAPYASLVLFAVDVDGSPLLLLSDLAQHSRNIALTHGYRCCLMPLKATPIP